YLLHLLHTYLRCLQRRFQNEAAMLERNTVKPCYKQHARVHAKLAFKTRISEYRQKKFHVMQLSYRQNSDIKDFFPGPDVSQYFKNITPTYAEVESMLSQSIVHYFTNVCITCSIIRAAPRAGQPGQLPRAPRLGGRLGRAGKNKKYR